MYIKIKKIINNIDIPFVIASRFIGVAINFCHLELVSGSPLFSQEIPKQVRYDRKNKIKDFARKGKRGIAIMFILVIVLNSNSLFAQLFGGGTGTKSSPYRIYTREHLEELSVYVAASTTVKNWSYGKYFILMNDIRDSVRTVIGNTWKNNGIDIPASKDFQGNFDGQGYKITLAIEITKDTIHYGLFGQVSGDYIELKNIIVDGYIRGTVPSRSYIGGIVGQCYYRQENNKEYITNITIKNCINMADISIYYNGNYSVTGGIVAHVFLFEKDIVIIEDCINMGNLEAISTSANATVSGITTNNHCFGAPSLRGTPKINRCVNTGHIKGSNAAGIAANYNLNYNNDDCNITNCINTGIIEGRVTSGGITNKK